MHVHAFCTAHLCGPQQRVQVRLLRVHTAVGKQPHQMKLPSPFAVVVNRAHDLGMLVEASIRDHGADAGDIHPNHATCPAIQLADFAVAHLSVRQADKVIGSMQQRIWELTQQPIVIRLARLRNCVRFALCAIPPPIQNGQHQRLGHVLDSSPYASAVVSQCIVNALRVDSTVRSRMLPPTEAPRDAIELRSWSLRRITSGSSWIPEIDGLRFIAIVLVVLFHLSAEVTTKSGTHFNTQHWYESLFDFFGRGDIGVRIFFVISGFILGRPFARHYLLGQPKPSLRSYYLRRLTRLEPPYLINIAVCAVSIVLYARVPLSEMLPHFAASAVYLQGFLSG